MRTLVALSALLVAFGVSACKTTASEPEPAPKGTATSASAPKSADRFGEPITSSDAASLAAVAKNPAAYKGKTIVTTGKVTRVCQERGCWMAIKDSASDATVRMHGHSFFVPMDAAGREARVQGSVMMTKDGKECDEMEAVGAQLEIDATGVELSPPSS